MSNQELDASSIDPSREVEELDVNSIKEEMYKLKQQMAEMYLAWAKGQPPPAYPANPAFIPPLTQTQKNPTVDSSAGFRIYHHYQGTTSQTPQAPPPKPVLYPPPLATPIFIAPMPATIHRSSSEPLFQAHDNQYYPPEPTFKAPEPYSYTPRFDLPVEAEKPSKNPE
ncbi:proline-rich receptor-like protein kinase PERK13 [Nicotiana sylvestris]|uniref:proline-rich receptor-like protein kinase PERK13 n=1 Tax=Nicotiana sylvestris TaxID=4096 RepID=UPI00388CB49A